MASASGPLVRLCRSLTPAVFATLRRQGYAVVDGAVGAHWRAALRIDIDQLNATGRLHLNSTHLVAGGCTKYLEKSNVWEAEGADPAVLADCSALAATARHRCAEAFQSRYTVRKSESASTEGSASVSGDGGHVMPPSTPPGARPGPPARPGRPIRPHGPRALLFPAFLSGHPCHQAPFSRRPRCLSAPPVSSSIRLSPHAMRITPSAGILKIWQRKQRDSRA